MSEAIDFAALARRCHGELLAVLLARSRNREVAKDLLQDVLLCAWRRRCTLLQLPPDQQRRYLFAMAKNRAIDSARQSKAPLALTDIDPAAPAPAPPDDRIDMLTLCIDRLPEPDRELLLLATIGGLDSQQLAERFDANPSTVRSRLSRIRSLLRDCITTKLEEAPHARR